MIEEKMITVKDASGCILLSICGEDIITINEVITHQRGDDLCFTIPVVCSVEKRINFHDQGGWEILREPRTNGDGEYEQNNRLY